MNNGPNKQVGADRTERGNKTESHDTGTENEMSEPATEAMLRLHMGERLALPAGFKERVLARAAAEARADSKADADAVASLPGLVRLEAPLKAPSKVPLSAPSEPSFQALLQASFEDREQRSKPDRTPGKVFAFPQAAMWRRVAGGVLAASVLAGTFGVESARRHRAVSREARERVVANQQFEQATRITDAALAHTREQLQRAGVLENEGRW